MERTIFTTKNAFRALVAFTVLDLAVAGHVATRDNSHNIRNQANAVANIHRMSDERLKEALADFPEPKPKSMIKGPDGICEDPDLVAPLYDKPKNASLKNTSTSLNC